LHTDRGTWEPALRACRALVLAVPSPTRAARRRCRPRPDAPVGPPHPVGRFKTWESRL
jgi:hypothetical protein